MSEKASEKLPGKGYSQNFSPWKNKILTKIPLKIRSNLKETYCF